MIGAFASAQTVTITDFKPTLLKAPSALSVGTTVNIVLTADLPSGGPHLYIQPLVLPTGAAYVTRCGWNFHTACQFSSGMDRIWNAGGIKPMLYAISGLPIGKHTIKFVTRAQDIERTVSHTVSIEPVPSLLKPTAYAKWEDIMVKGADKFCVDPVAKTWATQSFGTFSYEGTVWYYDGARVFFQIADYTANPKYLDCAFNIVDQYANHVIASAGKLKGYQVFTRGLRFAWERTQDPRYKEAIRLLATQGLYSTSGGMPDEYYIRESAFSLHAMVDAELAGLGRNPLMARNVDYILGMFNTLFVTGTYTLHHSFFDGLAAESLIAYYQLTKDPRIVPAIKLMTEWIWTKAYNRATGKMVYNPEPLGPKCASGCQVYFSDLMNLVIPAMGWLASLTHDDELMSRAEEMFGHSLDGTTAMGSVALDSGKHFSQNYRWSFDYVKLR
jgi:hypothetical protein